MSLDRFKNITDVVNKGTSLTTELNLVDLELIDKGFKSTPFNIGVNDALEFVLYDASNNLLQQQDYGSERYIKGEEISEYLIQSENITDKLIDGGGFLIDVKRLIKEAGYNTGIFRVQLNFVNDRIGSSVPKDKLWVQEISPTRLELRLLPFDNFDETNPIDIDTKIDLNQSYNSFVEGKFSGDEVYAEIDEILNRLTPSELQNTFQKIKSEAYINQLASEFSLNSWEIFFTKVLDSMRTAVRHALLHKNSTIGSNNFGEYLSDLVDFKYYNKKDIINLLNRKFEEAVDYHLPKRTLSEEVKLDYLTQNSIDKLQQLVQTIKSDVTNTNPKAVKATIEPPTSQEIRDGFTKERIVVQTPTAPIVMDVPVIKPTVIEPAPIPTPVITDMVSSIYEPEVTNEAIEKNRLRRLQEEMMYQQGGMGTRYDVPYQSPYEQPSIPTNNGGGGGVVLQQTDYIYNNDVVPRPIKNEEFL
jgi:hypothetical protein